MIPFWHSLPGKEGGVTGKWFEALDLFSALTETKTLLFRKENGFETNSIKNEISFFLPTWLECRNSPIVNNHSPSPFSPLSLPSFGTSDSNSLLR